MVPSSLKRLSPFFGFVFVLSLTLFLFLGVEAFMPSAYASEEMEESVPDESSEGPTVVFFGEPPSEETLESEAPAVEEPDAVAEEQTAAKKDNGSVNETDESQLEGTTQSMMA